MTKLPLSLLDIYTCRVKFSTVGWITNSKNVSVNKPLPEWGIPLELEMIPSDDTYQIVKCKIPAGARAVFIKRRAHVSEIDTMNGNVIAVRDGMDSLESLIVLGGWGVGNICVMDAVNMATKKVTHVHEQM